MTRKDKGLSGRVKVQPILHPLSAEKFYAGIRKQRGPKRRQLTDCPPKQQKQPTGRNPYRFYTISYKLRVLAYWYGKNIRCGPTKYWEPTQLEVARYFRIPVGNLSKWKKDKRGGKYTEARKGQGHLVGGGRQRQWKELEWPLYEELHQRRAIGRPVRRGWFRRVSRELFEKLYQGKDTQLFRFSNGWFRGFLQAHQISQQFRINSASKLPADFSNAILYWMKFNRGNSQLRPDDEMGLGDIPGIVGRYRLQNICNMDQTPLPFQ